MISSSLVACSKSDIPDGYQLIAREGDEFRLYVPTQGWMPNTAGGITSAFFAVSSDDTQNPGTSVNVYVDDAAGELSIEEYWESCNEKYTSELDGYEFLVNEGKNNTSFGGGVCKQYVYSASIKINGQSVKYKFMQLMEKYNGKMFLLVFSSPESEYEARVVDFIGDSEDLGIIGYFKFAEPYKANEDKKYSNDENIPEGMKLASSKERPYTLFAPNDWEIEKGADITTVIAKDKSNLSVQYTMPDGTGHTVEKYWNECIEKYKNITTNFSAEEPELATVGGVEGGYIGVFSGKSGGVEYKFKQAIVLKGDVFYVVTYTATAENFDAHLSEVDKMIENFIIK